MRTAKKGILCCLFSLFMTTASQAETLTQSLQEDNYSNPIALNDVDLSVSRQHGANAFLQTIVSAIDYHTRKIYLINYDTNVLITVDPLTIEGWPGDIGLQHTMILPRGKKLYISTDSSAEFPAYLIVLDINSINWRNRDVDMTVATTVPMSDVDASPELPYVKETTPSQPIPNWLLPSAIQVHGPTILPYSRWIYFTDWTRDKIRVINRFNNELARLDPIIIPDYTEQTHGIVFNEAGTIGLGSGYYFDNNKVDLYGVNRRTGELLPKKQIMLGNDKKYAAFTHYVSWLDERYAVTGTMQLDKTSLTPEGTEVIPPSVWLIDAWEGTAKQILGQTDTVDGNGILRTISDIAVVGNKLIIAEEDSIDSTFAEDGFIAIFDMTVRTKPRLIKRLQPGVELPEDFAVAHTISPTPNGRFAFIGSWASGYIVKVDLKDNKVQKVFGPKDGMVMPHGLFSSGIKR